MCRIQNQAYRLPQKGQFCAITPFDPAGQLIRVLTRVLEGDTEVAGMDTNRYSLARGCGLTAPHPTVETVRDHLAAELGDIEGGRGDYTVPPLDWCAIATD